MMTLFSLGLLLYVAGALFFLVSLACALAFWAILRVGNRLDAGDEEVLCRAPAVTSSHIEIEVSRHGTNVVHRPVKDRRIS
jgi:hypothetical protein